MAVIGEPKLQFKEVDRLLTSAKALLEQQALDLGHSFATCPATDSAAFDKILSDALIFLTERFCHEEDLMRSFTAEPLLRNPIDRHKEDHAELSAELLAIVLNLQKHGLMELVPRFQRLFGPSLDNHRRNHDAILDRWLAETNPEYCRNEADAVAAAGSGWYPCVDREKGDDRRRR